MAQKVPGPWIEHGTSRNQMAFSLLLSQLSYPGDHSFDEHREYLYAADSTCLAPYFDNDDRHERSVEEPPRLSPLYIHVFKAQLSHHPATLVTSRIRRIRRAIAQGSRANPRLVDDDPVTPTTCHFTPFDEHLNSLNEAPRCQTDLSNPFTNIFRISVLSGRAIDDMVAPALRRPTRAKIRILARAVYIHWTAYNFGQAMQTYLRERLLTLLRG